MENETHLLEHHLEEEKRLFEIESNIQLLTTEVSNLRNDVSDLVVAWKAANWLVGLVRWVGGIAIAISAIATVIKLKG